MHAVGALAAVAQRCSGARRAAIGSLESMCGGLVEVALNATDALRYYAVCMCSTCILHNRLHNIFASVCSTCILHNIFASVCSTYVCIYQDANCEGTIAYANPGMPMVYTLPYHQCVQ